MNEALYDVDMKAVFQPYKDKVVAIVGQECDLSCEEDGEDGDVWFRIHTKRDDITYFTMLQLPGCCGVAISTGAFVAVSYRARGLGTLLNELRKDIAREAGYTVLMCTDVTYNTPQRKILEKNGWKDVFSFVNRRTGNEVAISVVEL